MLQLVVTFQLDLAGWVIIFLATLLPYLNLKLLYHVLYTVMHKLAVPLNKIEFFFKLPVRL